MLGRNPTTWAPRGTESLSRQQVEESMPELAGRGVYERFKRQAADSGAHIYNKQGDAVLEAMSTVLPVVMANVAQQI